VSVASSGLQANGASDFPSLSADGSIVCFQSAATNLVGGDNNAETDLFAHDGSSGTTTRVSVATSGVQADGPTIANGRNNLSFTGRFVAFESRATNLVIGDTNGAADVFLHDRTLGQTTRVSLTAAGAQIGGASLAPSISADGRMVAFHSPALAVVPDDTNGANDVFLRDLAVGTTVRVSVATTGGQANGGSDLACISADGTAIAFESLATNLVAGDTNGIVDAYVRDRSVAGLLGTTVPFSVQNNSGILGNATSLEAAISANGATVAFSSDATNLVAGDTNVVRDVFVRQGRSTLRMSLDDAEVQADGASDRPAISGDGNAVAFRFRPTPTACGTSSGGP